MQQVVALAVVLFAAYHDALSARFVLDDYHYILENASLSHVAALFVRGYDSGGATFYRPLSTASFAIDRALFGTWAAPYHAENLVWHFAATLALLGVLRRFFSPSAAFVGAVVFAVHPVHTEAVTGIVGRMELMAATFTILGAWAWLSRRYFWACACALAALLCKESGLLCVPLALVLDAWSARTVRRAGLWLVVPLVLYAALRTIALHDALLPMPDPVFATIDRQSAFATALDVLGRNLRLLVWPHPLVADYSYASIAPSSSVLSFAPLVGLGSAVLLVVIAVVVRGYVAIGVLIIGAALLPVSNLIVHINVLMAERLLYAPSIGVALLVAGAYAAIEQARSAKIVAGAVIATGAVLCMQRNLDWETPLSLWQDTVEKQPMSALAHANLALACETVGDRRCALRELGRAVEIEPFRQDFVTTLEQLKHAPPPH